MTNFSNSQFMLRYWFIALLLVFFGCRKNEIQKIENANIHDLVLSNNIRGLAEFLERHPSKVDQVDSFGSTALDRAAGRGKLEAAKLLLKYGADYTATNTLGNSPLHTCALSGIVDVAEELIKQGADVNQTAEWPRNKALLEGKKDTGITPLHLACLQGKIKMVKLLLLHGCKVNATDFSGATPLHDVTQYYRQRGLSQEIQDSLIMVLIDAGADVNAKTISGDTFLDLLDETNRDHVQSLLKKNRVVLSLVPTENSIGEEKGETGGDSRVSLPKTPSEGKTESNGDE